MKVCPITYQLIEEGRYSSAGLKKLSPRLRDLLVLPYSAEAQLNEARARATKMSIQGVQPKLSAILSVAKQSFVLVDRGGRYVLKPPNPFWPEIPENEDLTMRMAGICGIEVPLHGLVYSVDESRTYFVKRFDRVGRAKRAVEDFAQLAEKTRDTKYSFSMEKVARVIEEVCTFPQIEKLKLFRLVLFNFLTGNEDGHLKNFSVIRREGKIELSPAYDLVNTTIALSNPAEELALPLNGKKRQLKRQDFFDYFGRERLQLADKALENVVNGFGASFAAWELLIDHSFLSAEMKSRYLDLLTRRREILRI